MFEVANCDLKHSPLERLIWRAFGGFGFITFAAPIHHILPRSQTLRCVMPKLSSESRRLRRSSLPRTAAVSIALPILILRHQRVILDTALAELYKIPVKRLNEQTKRNRKRFPADFMFQLTARENRSLRSQFATSNIGRGGRRSLPFAFTEHGAIMAATVVNSDQAVEMSVFVVRAFVRLRQALVANKDLATRLEILEKHLETHDDAIEEIIQVINRLMEPPPRRPKKIGFSLPISRTG